MEDMERYYYGASDAAIVEGIIEIELDADTQLNAVFYGEYSQDCDDSYITKLWYDHSKYNSVECEIIDRYLKNNRDKIKSILIENI